MDDSSFLRIANFSQTFFLGKLRNAVEEATKVGKISPVSDGSELNRLFSHVTSRVDLLPSVFERVNASKSALDADVAQDHDILSELASGGQALPIEKVWQRLVNHLLLDIDSLFFETIIVCEILTKLLEQVYRHVGKEIHEKGPSFNVMKALETRTVPTDWYRALNSDRNFFTHEGTPLLAIDLGSSSLGVYEYLFLKNHLTDFKREKDFRRWSEVLKLARGFLRAISAIEDHLADVVNPVRSGSKP